MPVVATVACVAYEPTAISRAVTAALAPLGGVERLVRPGMQVLLKPNLVTGADREQAITTHPAVVQAVVEIVQAAGGQVWIGDSPVGPSRNEARVWRKSGVADVAARTGARMVPFDKAAWRQLDGRGYFVAPPVLDADLVINLPKLKTHSLTLYTGAVKNLFGAIPGTRKKELHCQNIGTPDFGRVLVDVLELVRPALTILDGVLGQEGNGPGAAGTPRRYGCLAASTDPVALDAVITLAMGYRPGEVRHLVEADARGLGVADPAAVRVEGDRSALDFGRVLLPTTRSIVPRLPAWISTLLHRVTRVRPRLQSSACTGCGQCAEACPPGIITPGRPPEFDMGRCIGCLCCAEICPQGAITPGRALLARLIDPDR